MKSIQPAEIEGAVSAPPSKSMTVRAIAAASLNRGQVRIEHPSSCEDAASALRVIEALGSKAGEKDGDLFVERGAGEEREAAARILHCGESGLCMRIFAPIAALSPERTILTASGSLSSRPMGMVEALVTRKAQCTTANGYPPISIRGPLEGGPIEIDGSMTSQFLTGLLMALPLCKEDSVITVSGMASLPYVKMTLSLLESFGVKVEHDDSYGVFSVEGGQEYAAGSYRVEGDWSAAAFLLVAGAIAGSVLVEDLREDSLQADRAILDALVEAGVSVAGGGDCVYVRRNKLTSFSFDATDCPDLFPPLVALASRCEGTSKIRGVHRLAHKESNRARALAEEFGKMGIPIVVLDDVMAVKGGVPRGALVDSHGDHRIAMACAVAALAADGPTTIGNPGAVAKSYPAFFDDLALLTVTR